MFSLLLFSLIVLLPFVYYQEVNEFRLDLEFPILPSEITAWPLAMLRQRTCVAASL